MKSFRLSLLAAGLAACALAAQAQLKLPGAKPAASSAAPAAPAAAPAQGLAASNGVISNPEYEKAGQMAAHAWLLLLDRKDWGTAWDASSGVFRQTVPLGTWMDNIPKLREPLGAFVERQPGGAVYKRTLAGRPEADYVTVQFTSKFAKKAEVQELVTTVREPDGRWRVTGYQTK
ncbi:MAG TPA: DUF4019 domain-containing protein [Ramlibacter sp.]|nr:DUF4019 domain-containing protein [Ramlibacter sp.]